MWITWGFFMEFNSSLLMEFQVWFFLFQCDYQGMGDFSISSWEIDEAVANRETMQGIDRTTGI